MRNRSKVKEICTKIAVAFIALWSLNNGQGLWLSGITAPFEILSISLGLSFLLWLVIPTPKEKKRKWLKINIILLICYLFILGIALIGAVVSD